MAQRIRRVSRSWPVLTALTVTVLFLASTASAAVARGDFTAKLRTSGHAPTARSYWPISLRVTRGSIKLNGNVDYEFFSDGQLVSRRHGHVFTEGAFNDRLCFPPLAIGHPLKLGIVVTTRYGTSTLFWTVNVTSGTVTHRCRASL
jgi:hypothetical protein